MSNITTAGNLSVSQNTTIGGNLSVSGNILPTGDLNISGNINATNLNVNSTVKFNNSLIIEAGAGALNLNSNPLYGESSGYNFMSYTPLVGSQTGMQMAGYIGGQLGYTSQSGPYPNNITPVIYWNDSDRVGINTTSPNVVAGLHINGELRVNYDSFFAVDGTDGNVYIGNTEFSKGNLYINSQVPSIDTTSGSLVVNGGAGILGNVCIGDRTICNRFVSNGLDDLRLYTGDLHNIYVNNDGDGSLIINQNNFTGSSTFANGDVYIGNLTSSSGQLIVQSDIEATGGGTGALIVTGGTSISGNLIVSSTGVLKANASVSSTTTSTGTITTKGGIGCLGNINCGGNVNANNMSGNYGYFNRIVPSGPYDLRIYTGTTNTTYINSDSSGDLRFNTANTTGKIYFDNGNVSIGNISSTSGQLQLVSGISSTSTGTGAMVITGGAGISGNLNVGGTINGAISTTSTITTTGNITGGNLISTGIVELKNLQYSYTVNPTPTASQFGYTALASTSGTYAAGTTILSTTGNQPVGTYLVYLLINLTNGATAQNIIFGHSNSLGVHFGFRSNTNTVAANFKFGTTLTFSYAHSGGSPIYCSVILTAGATVNSMAIQYTRIG
jgi:hypothetical protein